MNTKKETTYNADCASDESTKFVDSDTDLTTISEPGASSAALPCTKDHVLIDSPAIECQENVNHEGDSDKVKGLGTRVGILIGGITSLFIDFDTDEQQSATPIRSGIKHENPAQNPDTQNPDTPHPDWADKEMAVASAVNDGMSFSEAFAAARKEHGVGASFEWRGKIYGTYTADEWNKLSDENRAEFADHFAWDKIDAVESDVAQAVNDSEISIISTTQTLTDDDDIEIISVTHEETYHYDPLIEGETPKLDEVEVLGVELPSDAEGLEVEIVDIPAIDDIPLTTPPGDLYALNDAPEI